jgi:hypothetical protein
MKAYWIKIALGALGIFVLGMVLISAGKHGVDHAREAIQNSALRLASADGPFMVDGRRLGNLSSLQLLPGENEGIPRIELAVRLDANVAQADLGDCILVVPENEKMGENGLQCMPSEAAGKVDLVEIGSVRIEPSGEVLPLEIPRAMLNGRDWADHFRRSPAGSHAASGFQLQADSSGAFMMIRDQHGKPVFQLNADSSGAFIQFRDSNGKELLRFHADSTGVKGNLQAN